MQDPTARLRVALVAMRRPVDIEGLSGEETWTLLREWRPADEDDEEALRELWTCRVRQQYDELPRLDCCDVGRACVGISSLLENPDGPPHWLVSRWKRGEVDFGGPMHASHCPGCGQRLPDLRRKTVPPIHIAIFTDGGYYCDHCGERADSCPCSFPAAAWEAVPPEARPETRVSPP